MATAMEAQILTIDENRINVDKICDLLSLISMQYPSGRKYIDTFTIYDFDEKKKKKFDCHAIECFLVHPNHCTLLTNWSQNE